MADDNEKPLINLESPIITVHPDSSALSNVPTENSNQNTELVPEDHKKLDFDELSQDAAQVDADHARRASQTLADVEKLTQALAIESKEESKEEQDQISLSSTPQVPEKSPSPVVASIPPILSTLLTRFSDSTIFYEIPPFDPVGDLLLKQFPSDEQRPVRNLPQMDENALQQIPMQLLANSTEPAKLLESLIQAESWRNVAQVSKRWLVTMPEVAQVIFASNTIDPVPAVIDQLMQLWFIRCTSLTKLRLFQLAVAELERAGITDSPTQAELLWESYAPWTSGVGQGRKQGTCISFDLRVAACKIPGQLGDVDASIDRLWTLLDECQKYTQRNDIWKSREVHLRGLIATILASNGDERNALRILSDLAKEYPKDVDIKLTLLRLKLSIGDVSGARGLLEGLPSNDVTLTHSQMLDMAKGSWDDAVEKSPSNPAARNNLALAHLYSGNIRQAIETLESLVQQTLSEPIVFNLSTMYDLAGGVERKKGLLANVATRAGDTYGVDALKL